MARYSREPRPLTVQLFAQIHFEKAGPSARGLGDLEAIASKTCVSAEQGVRPVLLNLAASQGRTEALLVSSNSLPAQQLSFLTELNGEKNPP